MKSLVLSTLATLFSAHLAAAVQPLIVEGNDFVNSVTKDRFVMVGVAYQPAGASGYDPSSGSDPLSDANACLRDAAVMQKLGINTIRVYTINPAVNHDECVSIFNAVGIYIALDVNSPLGGESLNRYDPGSSYTEGYLSRVFSVVDAFKGYPNVLGFFAGNEVVNDVRSASVVPPYIRAVQRDLKQYIAKNADRVIPVGYSAADEDNRRPMWAYLTCGTDADSRADFYGLNSYEWCGDSTWETSGYQGLVDTFSNSSVPLFFSEFGCNKIKPRPFTEIPELYGPRMIDNWSGGLVYEYSEETSQYGLVDIASNGDASLLKDFDNLQSQYNKINITLITTRSDTPETTVHPSCNSTYILLSHSAQFNTSMSLPDCPAPNLIANGVGNKNIGKLVNVTTLQSPHKVFTSGGAQISNLAIVPLPADKSNTPNGENTSSTVTTTDVHTANATKANDDKGDAGRFGMSLSAAAVAGAVFMFSAMI